jgi:hypothetical protein
MTIRLLTVSLEQDVDDIQQGRVNTVERLESEPRRASP